MNAKEHRDLLYTARAYRAAQANEDDFRAFTQRQELMGGLS